MAATREPGRPPKPEKQKRGKRLDLRLLPEDREMLEDAAILAKTTLSDFVLRPALARARRILKARLARQKDE